MFCVQLWKDLCDRVQHLTIQTGIMARQLPAWTTAVTAVAKRGTVKLCLASLVFLSIITILWNYVSTPELNAWFPMAGTVRNTLPLKDDFCAKDYSTVGERNTAACTLLFQQKNYTDCIYVVLMYTIILVLSSFCFCLVCLIVCLSPGKVDILLQALSVKSVWSSSQKLPVVIDSFTWRHNRNWFKLRKESQGGGGQ